MSAGTTRLLLSLGAAAGYALLMSANPVRGSLRDGLRCVRRYKQVWGILAFCGVAAAVFLWAVRCYEWWTVPGARPALTPWLGWRPVQMRLVAGDSIVPTLLSVAAVFDCLVTLFPLSVVAAALFLVNWRGYQAVVFHGVTRRLGVAGGVAVHLGLVCCALASLAKPVLLFGHARLLAARLDEHELALAGGVIYWLSFAFEYFLGVGLQIYLVLLCFAWVRGLSFDFDKLRRFALRRFAFVVKWAVVVLVLSSIGINLPVVVDSVLDGEREWLVRTVVLSQLILPLILVGFCSMQLTLIFHNESLRRAFADHFRLMRRHAGSVGWLVAIAGIHFFLLALAGEMLGAAGGTGTWPLVIWRLLIYPVLWAALGGWFLASWVCLFRRCETNRRDLEELVQF
jgi:hypothetical protein